MAQSAFPLGNVYLRVHDEFGGIYQDEAFTALFPHAGSRPKLRGAWRSSPCSSLQKACLIARRRMLSAVASIGSTCLGWSSVIRASITPY